MGLFDSILGAAGPILGSGISALASFGEQSQMNQLQQEAWQRDDTAVQRRVADLRAAGLAPQLAAGGSVSSAPIAATSAAKAGEEGGQDVGAMVSALLKAPGVVGRSAAEDARLEAQQNENDAKGFANVKEREGSNMLVNPRTGRIAIVDSSGVADDKEAMPVWQAERIAKLRSAWAQPLAYEGAAQRGEGILKLSEAEAQEILRNAGQRPAGLSQENWNAILDVAKNVIGLTLRVIK